MQRLEVSGAVRPIYGSLGVKRLTGRIKAQDLIPKLKMCVWSYTATITRVCMALFFIKYTTSNPPRLCHEEMLVCPCHYISV